METLSVVNDKDYVPAVPPSEDDWLMAPNPAAERIEAKIDRLVNAMNDLHRELGVVLARDVEQEKAVARFMSTTQGSRAELGGEIDKLDTKHTALQREFDGALGRLEAKVAILMAVAGTLGVAVFGLLVNLVARSWGG